MPSRRFDANNNQLVTAAGQTRGALWTAAAWLHIGEAIGKDTSNWNAILISVSATTPYGASGLRVAKSGSRWFLSAIHDMSTADGYVIAAMPFELRDWIFVAAAHGSDGTEPRIWCGTPTAPIVEIPPYLTNHTAGTGSSVTATGNYYVGGYGANNIIAGCVAWPAWWVGAVLSAGELDTYRAETAVGRWPNIGKESLLGLWPLGETNATASGRDLSGGAKTLTASNFATGDIGPGVDDIAVADDWWWRAVEAPAAGSNATVTPNAVTASVAVPASTRTASGTVTPAAVAASVTVPAPTVVGTATARDLDGSDDQFSVTAAPAYTGDWTWCGHLTLDAAGGYLWRAQTSGGTACQTVAVKTIGGRVRLEATQGRATTGAVCQWEMPLPLGTDLTLAVQYESSTGRFRAWAGLADVPMTELAWRYSQTLGSGASTGGGTDWYISPSTGRVDGSISWVTVAPNITATKADFEGIRLFWDPPYAWTGSSGGSWKFDESSGNAADTSGNGRTMIASGTPSVRARTQTPYPESSVPLTLTGVPDCRIYQRNGSNQFPIPIAGTFGGTPEKIEARFTPFGATPGSWTTIDAAPSGGTYSGTLTVDLGQGILEVRADQGLSGSEHVYTYIRRFGVGVGDVYLAVGTSNASGIELTGGYNRVDAWLTDYEFGTHPFPVQMSNRKVANETHEWHEIHDPTDAYSAASTDLPSRTNSIYGPSSSWTQGTYTPTDNTTDTTSSGAGKSMWPALASLILQYQGVPVAIVPVAKGGSNLASWHLNVANYWNDLRARCEELAGVSISDSTPLDGTQAIGVLAVHGENDYGANPATYEANSSTLGSIRYWCVNNVLGNLGLPTWLMVTGDWPGTSAYNYTAAPQDGITRVRAANQAAWAELPVLPGPVTYELDLADGGGDGFHYRTQAELDTVTKRWYACIVEAWYGGASGSGRGPQVTGCTRSGTTVTVQMDVTLDAAAGGYDGISVYDGTPAPGTRLTWVSSAPSAGQYTAVRGGTTSQVIITLGAAPSGTVYFGVGEYDLSAGKTVPSVTRTVGGVAVTLPAEVATGVAASVAPAPSAVAATATVPAPTVAVSRTATPSTVTASVTVPASTRTATANVTAAVTTASVTVPASTRTASGTVTAAAVGVTVTPRAPAIIAGSSTTVAPSTVTGSVTPRTPTIHADGTVSGVNLLADIAGVWVLHEYANTAALTNAANKSNMRAACDAIGATGKLAGICVRFPWNQVDLVNDPSGAAAYLNAAIALRDYVRVNWPDIGLSIRMMAGKYTPAAVTAAGPYYTYNGNDIPVPWTDGTTNFNTAYETAYEAQVAALATWARSNGVQLLHLCWYGRDYSELCRNGSMTGVTFGTPPGLLAYASPYTSNVNQFVESHRRIIDLSWPVGGNDLILEYPLSGRNIDTGASNSIRNGLADKMLSLSGGNWSPRCAMQANGWGGMGDTASGGAANAGDWGAGSSSIEDNADTVWTRQVVRGEQDIAGVTFTSGTWATMFASLVANEATYCEIYDFTINGLSGPYTTELNNEIGGWSPQHASSGTIDFPAVTTSVRAPTIVTGSNTTVTPSTVAASATVPAPTRTATATVTPAAVTASTAVPAPTAGTGVTVTPASVSAAATVPAVSLTASGTATPSPVAGTATVQAPGIQAGSSVTIAPSTITISTSVPAPTRVATATATPATATTTVTILPPAITAGSSTTVVPAAVTAAVTVPSAATASSTIAAPATVTTTVIVQAPTRAATGTATPAAVAAMVTVPTPGVSTGSSATASPATIASTVVVASTTSTATATIPAAAATATVAVLAPAIQEGSSATVIAAVVTASAAVPAAARTASATVTAALAATTAQALPATVQIAGPTTVAAPRVTAAAAVLTVWVSTGATTADQWRVAGRLSRKWRAGGLSR